MPVIFISNIIGHIATTVVCSAPVTSVMTFQATSVVPSAACSIQAPVSICQITVSD